MRTTLSVDIDCPIDEVFDYTLRNVVEWSHTVIEDVLLEETPEHVGTRFRIVTEENGRRMEFDGTVVSHDPPFSSAILLRGRHFDIEVEYLFEDLGGRTRVAQQSKVHARGATKLIMILFGWLMKRSGRKALEKELANLKRILETRDSPALS